MKNQAKKILQRFSSVVEDWEGGKFADEEGNKWSVNKVVNFAQENRDKYYHPSFPIKKIKHDLSWWDKQHKEDPKKSDERTKKADTSYPLLVLQDKGHLSVADGLNRLKKAHSIEGKKHTSIYLVPKEDIEHLKIHEGVLGSLAGAALGSTLGFSPTSRAVGAVIGSNLGNKLTGIPDDKQQAEAEQLTRYLLIIGLKLQSLLKEMRVS